MKRIALYARVSTVDRGQAPEVQLRELRAWAQRLGAEVAAEYVDQLSGTRADRPALKAMLEAAHRREFDGVLVWALDRISREGIGPMVGYLEKLKAAGVVLKSHQEPWLDTANPVNDLLLAILSWVAAQERERIRERVRAGIARARAAGAHFGRPRVVIDATRVQRLLDQGLSVREVARRTGFSRATIARRFKVAQKPTPPVASNGADFSGDQTSRSPGSKPTDSYAAQITDRTSPGRAVVIAPVDVIAKGVAR